MGNYSSKNKSKIKESLIEINFNLNKIKRVWEGIENDKELALLEHIYDLAGFEESLEDLVCRFELFNKYINETGLIENSIVFIGDYNKLNIVTDNKHYTISSLAELKELKDDFTNTEIHSFTNFYLNNY